VVESKDTEIASLKTEIETLKKIIDYTNANAELLHERVEKIEHPPNETIWQAFRRMFRRKRTR
jgi:prefoldin subunit 5